MSTPSRDEFSSRTRQKFALRAAYTCSNPECRRRTVSPSLHDSISHSYIGVAAHISAASENGPRYDPKLTQRERKSIENGIHLCRDCATMIDNNKGSDYSIVELRAWKFQHEEWLRVQQHNYKFQFIETNRKNLAHTSLLLERKSMISLMKIDLRDTLFTLQITKK